MTYTTEQLIEFLDQEHKACNSGQRVFPLPDDAEEKAIEFAGVMGAFLGAKGLTQIGAYHDYRDQIHGYQQKHQVSGVYVRTEIMPDGSVFKFPEQHDQLVLVDGDMDILRSAKDRVLQAFFEQIQKGFYYLSHTIYSREGGEWAMETTLDFIRHFAGNMEWAAISSSDLTSFFGIGLSLQVGYGEPAKAGYTDSKDAESWFFDARINCPWNGPPIKAVPVKLSISDIVKMRQKREEE